MSSPLDPPIRRPSAPTPGPRDGDPDPLTPEESSLVVGEALRRINDQAVRDIEAIRTDTANMRRESDARLAVIEARLSDLVTHGTPAQRVHADSEITARHQIDARRLDNAARWQAVQTLIAAPPVQAGIVAGGSVVVVVTAALIWYLVTGETRPPIPGVSP